MTTTDGINRKGSGSALRKGVAILTLVLAGAAVQGCFIESGSSPPPPICDDGQIQTSWVVTYNGGLVECAPGDEVDMRVDTDAMTVTFPCGNHSGASPAVSGGVNHNVTFALLDANGGVLSQTSAMNVSVPCGTTVSTPRVTFSLTP